MKKKSSEFSRKTQDKCTIIKTEMMSRISNKMDGWLIFNFKKKCWFFLLEMVSKLGCITIVEHLPTEKNGIDGECFKYERIFILHLYAYDLY